MEDWLFPLIFGSVGLVAAARLARHLQIASRLPALLCEVGWIQVENIAILGSKMRGRWEGRNVEADYRFPGRSNPGALVLRLSATTPGVARIRRAGAQPLEFVVADLVAAPPVVETSHSGVELRGAPPAFAITCLEALPVDLLKSLLEQPYDEVLAGHGTIEVRKAIRSREELPRSLLSLPHEELRIAVALAHQVLSGLAPSSHGPEHPQEGPA